MSEVPDLKDSSGRMRRLVLSLLIGGAVAGIAYVIAHAVVQPETDAHKMHVTTGQMSGGTFVIWVTLVAFAVGFAAALAIQNALAKRAWIAENRIAKAKVR
ncbi:hypothetical protein BH11MYX3_BH11MYX3_36470 [soil metagenome]